MHLSKLKLIKFLNGEKGFRIELIGIELIGFSEREIYPYNKKL